MAESDLESGGFLSSLLGSVRTHIEDRLKSPFAGAFLLAWVAVNWKAILLIAFSSSPIEKRIEVLSTSHLSAANSIGWPLLYAFVGVICYYVIATVFLIMFEFYGIGRRAVEKKFDSHRWVDPESYIRFKQETRRQLDYYSGLAADHVDKIKELTSDLAKAEAEKRALGGELNIKEKDVEAAQGKVEAASVELNSTRAKVRNLEAALKTESARLVRAKDVLARAQLALSKSASYLQKSRQTEASSQSGLVRMLSPPSNAVSEVLKEIDVTLQEMSSALEV